MSKIKRYFSRLLCMLLILPVLSGCVSAPPDDTTERTDTTAPTEPPQSTTAPTEEATLPAEPSTAPETLPPVVLDHEAIQSVIDGIAEAYGAEGVQVAIISDGKVAGTYAYGWATRDEAPMTPDHKLRVASISKVFVGIAAMLLREDGTVELDRDISSYWDMTIANPNYPEVPVTIDTLLTHTSSIKCYVEDISSRYSDVVSRFQDGFIGSKPGSIHSWCYNNYAFRVLGLTLELAADRKLDELLQERLYTAMGMDAAFAAGDLQRTDLIATLYRANGEVARTKQTQMYLHAPNTPGSNGAYFAGSVTVSAADLAKLVALLASDGAYEGVQLMDAESVALMEQCMWEPLSDGSYQARPLFCRPDAYGRDRIYYHTGSGYGVCSCMSYDPAAGDGVVVLTTGATVTVDQYDIYGICSEINAYIYSITE